MHLSYQVPGPFAFHILSSSVLTIRSDCSLMASRSYCGVLLLLRALRAQGAFKGPESLMTLTAWFIDMAEDSISSNLHRVLRLTVLIFLVFSLGPTLFYNLFSAPIHPLPCPRFSLTLASLKPCRLCLPSVLK